MIQKTYKITPCTILNTGGKCAVAACAMAFALPNAAANTIPGFAASEIFGSIHAGGKYSLPTQSPPTDYLNEGADRIAQLGLGAIKVWLTPNPQNVYVDFSGSHPWPTGTETDANLKELLQSTYYKDLLDNPHFSTYIFVASEFVPKLSIPNSYATTNWKDGLSSTEESNVYNQFRDATKWLLQTYSGSGKTFIFQNWEGDNSLKLHLLDTNQWSIAVQGMTDWLNARQDGVDEGIIQAGSVNSVAVYNAAEINYNPGTNSEFPIPDEWCMVNAVIPQTSCDLYSWSNWASKTPGNEINMLRGLDYLRDRAPISTKLGRDNIYIGEFGAYESSYMDTSPPYHTSQSDSDYSTVIKNQLEYAIRWGSRYIVQWAVYDNGLRQGVSFDPENPDIMTEDQFVGTWLIRAQADSIDPYSYSFTSIYGHLAHYAGRQIHDDTLADFSKTDNYTSGLTTTTTVQPWNEQDINRVYRSGQGTTESIIYQTENSIVEWNIRVFIMSSDTAQGRLRGYTSTDGINWSSAFNFSDVDVIIPNPGLAPTWRRLHLGPPSAGIPPDTRFLKIEMYGTHTASGTQLGNVRIISEATATHDDPLNSFIHTASDLSSDNLTVTDTVAVYSEGDSGRIYRTTTEPGIIVYEALHIQNPRFKVFHYGTNIADKVSLHVSYDGIIWDQITAEADPSVATASGWYRTWVRAANDLPEGLRYIAIDFTDSNYSWTPQLGQVKFEKVP